MPSFLGDVLKICVVLAAAPLWWPVFEYLWSVIDPYPALRDPKLRGTRLSDVPRVEPLESEEWAEWKRRRQEELEEARAARRGPLSEKVARNQRSRSPSPKLAPAEAPKLRRTG